MKLVPIQPDKGDGGEILIMPREHAKLLQKLVEHEVMASCCFGDDPFPFDTKRELLELLELFDGE